MNIKKENLSKIAVKNSVYSLGFAMINKFGGLILTIILARLLLPELFGLYSLVLSVVVIVVILADFGTDVTAIRYISKALEENNKEKARSIFRFLFKIKSLMILISIIIVLTIAKPLSQIIFNKPLLFWPLIFSCFYIFAESLKSFFGTPFAAKKDIKVLLPVELIFQASKIVLSFIAISMLSYELKVSGIFLAFAISGFLFLALEIFFLIKKDKELILGKLLKINRQKILNYIGFAGIAGITLIFFGSIDTLMLGKFVDAEYLGYYRVALGLVVSISAILPFTGTLLPIFTQIHNRRLDRGFQKSFGYLIILIIPMSIGMMFISKHIILLIYGKEYLPAASSLLVLSILIVISPLISLYSTMFQAQEKPKILAKFMTISLVMNILLNYTLIKILLTISQEYAILGAGIATVISNVFFLGVLVSKTKSQFKIKIDKKIILKSIFSTIIMAIFLFAFMSYVDMNIFSGATMVILATIIYFSAMFFVKGITKEDINLFRTIFKR